MLLSTVIGIICLNLCYGSELKWIGSTLSHDNLTTQLLITYTDDTTLMAELTKMGPIFDYFPSRAYWGNSSKGDAIVITGADTEGTFDIIMFAAPGSQNYTALVSNRVPVVSASAYAKPENAISLDGYHLRIRIVVGYDLKFSERYSLDRTKILTYLTDVMSMVKLAFSPWVLGYDIEFTNVEIVTTTSSLIGTAYDTRFGYASVSNEKDLHPNTDFFIMFTGDPISANSSETYCTDGYIEVYAQGSVGFTAMDVIWHLGKNIGIDFGRETNITRFTEKVVDGSLECMKVG